MATANTVCVCLWYSKCVYMCEIHHHLQCCVWKAGLVVVVPCAMCLLSHIQASAALTRLQSQDAERLWMSIHKFTGSLWCTEAKNFSLSFHLRSSLSWFHLSSRVSLSACISEPDRYIGKLLLPADTMYWYIIALSLLIYNLIPYK